MRPGSLDITLKLANSYFLHKDYQQAHQLYTQIIKAKPQEARAWYNLGECYMNMKNPVKAFESFKQAIKLNIDMPHIELRIVSCLEQLGQFKEAKKILHVYLQKDNIPEQYKTAAKASLAQLDTVLAKQTTT